MCFFRPANGRPVPRRFRRPAESVGGPSAGLFPGAVSSEKPPKPFLPFCRSFLRPAPGFFGVFALSETFCRSMDKAFFQNLLRETYYTKLFARSFFKSSNTSLRLARTGEAIVRKFIALFLTGGPFRSARPEGRAHFLHLPDILPQIAPYEKRKNAHDKKISVDDAGLAANS